MCTSAAVAHAASVFAIHITSRALAAALDAAMAESWEEEGRRGGEMMRGHEGDLVTLTI